MRGVPTSTRVVVAVATIIVLFVCVLAAQGFRGVRFFS